MEAQAQDQARVSPDRARDWAQKYVDGWNSHDADRLLALASDDVTWEDPYIPGGVLRGKAAVREWLLSLWKAMPDVQFEIVGDPFISLDGTQVAAGWKGVARFTGPLDPPGFAPTGGHVEMTGIDIHEFDGELLRRVRTATDTMDLARQIGAAPAPGSGAERFGVLMQRLAARRLRAKTK